jgi:hypothetical protein
MLARHLSAISAVVSACLLIGGNGLGVVIGFVLLYDALENFLNLRLL